MTRRQPADKSLTNSWLEILRAALNTGQLPEHWPVQEGDRIDWRSLAEDLVALQQSSKSLAQRRASLYRASNEISASLNIGQVYEAVYQAVARVMPCTDFTVELYDEANRQIIPVHVIQNTLPQEASQVSPTAYPADHGLAAAVIQTGQAVRLSSSAEIQQIVQDESALPVFLFKNASALSVPIHLRGDIIGILSVLSDHPDAYSANDQELLEMLATHIAIAIDNARLAEQLSLLAATDPLTGIANRRQFFVRAEEAFDHARRYPGPLSAMMLDIDHFKSINDTYGHAMGDEVLRSVAQLSNHSLRKVDVVGRYGSEEFAFVLPETGAQGAFALAERLRRSIAGQTFQASQGDFQVTVSIGVTELREGCRTLQELLNQADQALYTAKISGRNRVVLTHCSE